MAGAKLSGAAQMRKRLERLSKKIPDEIGRALYLETEIETTEAKRRTPVDTGALRSSIRTIGPVREGRRIYTLIAAGGSSIPYALEVHENLEAFHKVGQAKYIESVILESRAYMARRVAARIELNRALS